MHLTKSNRVLSLLEVLTHEECEVDEYTNQPSRGQVRSAHKTMQYQSRQATKTKKVQGKQQFKRDVHQQKLQRKMDKKTQGGLVKRVAGAIAGTQAYQAGKAGATRKLLR